MADMMTAAPECFLSAFDEWLTLIDGHYDELSLHKRQGIPLKPQFGVYKQRAAEGIMLFIALRKNGELIGYLIGFISLGLHYETCLTCTPDIFYIHPAHRNGDAGALKLFRAAENELKRRGVRCWFMGSKNHKDTSRLFAALGFEAVETTHCKWLEG